MKIVIDIPDYVVEKEMYICYFKAWGETLESTFDKAEPLSDVLDKISAEIDEKISHYDHFENSNTANGLRMAKEIVEGYKGTANE